MFGNLGIWEIVVIFAVLLILFGPSKLPALGSALGEGIKNFRKSYREAKAIDLTPDENSGKADGPPSEKRP
jgi:sec-independent protein translocase protein TatA